MTTTKDTWHRRIEVTDELVRALSNLQTAVSDYSSDFLLRIGDPWSGDTPADIIRFTAITEACDRIYDMIEVQKTGVCLEELMNLTPAPSPSAQK